MVSYILFFNYSIMGCEATLNDSDSPVLIHVATADACLAYYCLWIPAISRSHYSLLCYEWGHTAFLATFWWLITGLYRDSVSANTPVSSQGVFVGIHKRCLQELKSKFSGLLCPSSGTWRHSATCSSLWESAGLTGVPPLLCCEMLFQPAFLGLGSETWNSHGTEWNWVAFSPPWNLDTLCSWQKRREDLQRGQYEYKRLLQLGTAGVMSSPFFSLFSPPNNWTQAFLLEVPLLLC